MRKEKFTVAESGILKRVGLVTVNTAFFRLDRARDVSLCPKPPLVPYIVCANSETSWMRGLTLAFAVRLCDKYPYIHFDVMISSVIHVMFSDEIISTFKAIKSHLNQSYD